MSHHSIHHPPPFPDSYLNIGAVVEELLHDVDDASVGGQMDGDDSAMNALLEEIVGTGSHEQQVDDRLRRVEYGIMQQVGTDQGRITRVDLPGRKTRLFFRRGVNTALKKHDYFGSINVSSLILLNF